MEATDSERASMAANQSSLQRRLESTAAAWGLSRRERAVLWGLLRGLDNKTIAGESRCAVRTVEAHITHILAKTGASTRLELVARFWLGSLAGRSAPEPVD
jgi:DNA-binding NarL/FixJ family response regulator